MRKRVQSRVTRAQQSTRRPDPRLLTPQKRKRLILKVCRLLATGRWLVRDACKKVGLGSTNRLHEWIQRDQLTGKGELAVLYARARELSAEGLEMKALRLASKATGLSWQRDRLEIDTLKWAAAKRRPRVYGDKLDVTSDGDAIPSVMQVELVTPNKKQRRKMEREVAREELSEDDDDA